MPLSYAIDRRRRVVVARASGLLTVDDAVRVRSMLQSDPVFRSHFSLLFDLREVTQVNMSFQALARLAATTVFAAHARRAFVCTTELQHEVAHAFSLVGREHQIVVRVFREPHMAESWLVDGRTPERSHAAMVFDKGLR
jgi:hypothetical protein